MCVCVFPCHRLILRPYSCHLHAADEETDSEKRNDEAGIHTQAPVSEPTPDYSTIPPISRGHGEKMAEKLIARGRRFGGLDEKGEVQFGTKQSQM